MCRFCLNAFVDDELTHDNDLSYLSIGFCDKGYAAYIRSGDRRPVAIVVSTWNESRQIMGDVVVYVPKFCPECGRELFENKKKP